MSKWEQNAVFETSECICLVKRINGVVAQKTIESELVRCGECKYTDGEPPIADGRSWCVLHGSFMYYCSDGERNR